MITYHESDTLTVAVVTNNFNLQDDVLARSRLDSGSSYPFQTIEHGNNLISQPWSQPSAQSIECELEPTMIPVIGPGPRTTV
jgi:hypothetical protein